MKFLFNRDQDLTFLVVWTNLYGRCFIIVCIFDWIIIWLIIIIGITKPDLILLLSCNPAFWLTLSLGTHFGLPLYSHLLHIHHYLRDLIKSTLGFVALAAAAFEIIFLPDSVLFHFILFLCTAGQSPSHSAAVGTSIRNDDMLDVEI